MSTPTAHSHTSGFASPVGDSQRVFRAVLESLARPTTPQPIEVVVAPPAPLGPTAGAVVLALCDEQTAIWLDPSLRSNPEIAAWIEFHTGARIVEHPEEALFVIVSSPAEAPDLAGLAQGTDEQPHRSATLVIDVRGAHATGALEAIGPGVRGVATWDGAGLPDGFLVQWQENHTLFPRGVDVILAAETTVVGLPRTTALAGEGALSKRRGS